LCKYIKRKTKYNKGVIRTDDWLVTSHSNMLALDSSDISPTQFYICSRTGCGIRYFCPSKQKTGYAGCWATT